MDKSNIGSSKKPDKLPSTNPFQMNLPDPLACLPSLQLPALPHQDTLKNLMRTSDITNSPAMDFINSFSRQQPIKSDKKDNSQALVAKKPQNSVISQKENVSTPTFGDQFKQDWATFTLDREKEYLNTQVATAKHNRHMDWAGKVGGGFEIAHKFVESYRLMKADDKAFEINKQRASNDRFGIEQWGKVESEKVVQLTKADENFLIRHKYEMDTMRECNKRSCETELDKTRLICATEEKKIQLLHDQAMEENKLKREGIDIDYKKSVEANHTQLQLKNTEAKMKQDGYDFELKKIQLLSAQEDKKMCLVTKAMDAGYAFNCEALFKSSAYGPYCDKQ